ncbi:MAG: MFS transporter [Reyranellaceae bacterium]
MSEAAPVPSPHRSVFRRVFPCIVLAFMVSMFYRGANGVIAPELMAELDMDPSTMGFVTGVFFLVFAVVQIPVGMALDRFGPRLVIGNLSLIAVVGAVVYAVAPDWRGLAVGRALLGLGCSATMIGAVVILSRWVSGRNLGVAVAALSATGAVGSVLATAPFAVIVEMIGWRNAFLVLSAVNLVAAVLVFVGVQDDPHDRQTSSRAESLGEVLRGVGEVLRSPVVPGFVALMLVAYPSALSISGLWGGPYLHDTFGLGQIERGNVLLLMMAAGGVGTLAIGYVDRTTGNRKGVIAGCSCLSILLLVSLAFSPAMPLWLVAAVLVVFGGVCNYGPLIHTHARTFFPERLAGRALATLNTAVMVGSFSMQWITGHIIGASRSADGTASTLSYQLMFGFLAAALATGLLVYVVKVRGNRP